MLNLTHRLPNFAPDGYAARPGVDYAAPMAAMAARQAETAAPGQARPQQREMPHFHNQDGYDEGLVHDHGWARVSHLVMPG